MKGSVTKKQFRESKAIQDDYYLDEPHISKHYLWLYPLLTAVIYYLSSFFINYGLLRIILSLLLSFLPCRELIRRASNNNHKHLRTQVLVMLQVLTTGVSSGYSLEKSLSLIRPVMEHTFGSRCPLIKPLIELENNIRIHMDIEKSLAKFAQSIDFSETIPLFHALAISSKIGNNSLAILRSSCQMLSEMNAVQNEISAANAGKNAEAVMLCIMPFAITIALDSMSGGYLTLARESTIGQILLGIAFVTAIAACALLFRFMSHSDRNFYKDADEPVKRSDKNNKYLIGRLLSRLKLTQLVKRVFPMSFISYRYELFSELSFNPEAEYEFYLRKQLISALLTFGISSAFLTMTGNNPLFAFLLTGLIIFAGARDIRRRAELKKEEMMKDIPLFLCLTCTLLEAGLQLPKTIEICSSAFRENKSLSNEIRGMRAMMLSGKSASDAVEQFSLRIQIPEAQAAFLLVARYGRLGTKEVLNLLSLQASSCWDLCRNTSRKKQEREALSMLLPMTLDFTCVLLVATTPAIISLGI